VTFHLQVSELSHKLGSAEGSNRSLEEEGARLKKLNQQLSSDKHERDIQLNEAKAKLIALDEKVSVHQWVTGTHEDRMASKPQEGWSVVRGIERDE
jgi:hypothetical protein